MSRTTESLRLKFVWKDADSLRVNRAVFGWVVAVVACALLTTSPREVSAQATQMRAVDQATVRVFALSGVDAERVESQRRLRCSLVPCRRDHRGDERLAGIRLSLHVSDARALFG
jgi:hypothetical protein